MEAKRDEERERLEAEEKKRKAKVKRILNVILGEDKECLTFDWFGIFGEKELRDRINSRYVV